jgi:hypothetical protein
VGYLRHHVPLPFAVGAEDEFGFLVLHEA